MGQQQKTILLVVVVVVAVAVAAFAGYKAFGPKKAPGSGTPTVSETKQGEGGMPAGGVSSGAGETLPPPEGWTPKSK